MILELLAAIALALSVGGLVVFLRKLSGGRLPKTAIPVMAALALVGFAVWGDYTWAARTASALPDRLVVVDKVSQSNVWRPWSFVFPVAERFVAADVGGARRNANDPDAVRVDLYFLERRVPAERQTVVMDCGAATPPGTDGKAVGDEADRAGRVQDLVCSQVPPLTTGSSDAENR
ncbi:hypothetical protein U0C82_00820 [Fulvimarina sp. 2208YS6-2-32]|uniref:Uncharacterized protein n=1 Tax=Fulvimarina uroteuthidis TaxID=3098149 RepID=A0ABU5HX29_9HYPH|nr:hypothetical protein [Fulvimarina sp. 2208YS6-2-32]MDY8107689.1 hypothetical protein [Fulvimarina sp. 2208YS6-2-32]